MSKKDKIKIKLDIGDLAIRRHNLWHRGSPNKTNESRFLMSFFLFPKETVKPAPVYFHLLFFLTDFLCSFLVFEMQKCWFR